MNWPYSNAVIHGLVQAPKSPSAVQSAIFTKQGEHGRELSLLLDLVDGGLYHLRLTIAAGRADMPETYSAAFLVDNRRVRGIDFSKIERRKRYRTHIPKGWHENVIDYGLPTTDADHNRHEPLPDFTGADLQDFLRSVTARWNIEIDFNENLW